MPDKLLSSLSNKYTPLILSLCALVQRALRGEISIGVNPGSLKLWGKGRSTDQSPEKPQGVTTSSSLW